MVAIYTFISGQKRGFLKKLFLCFFVLFVALFPVALPVSSSQPTTTHNIFSFHIENSSPHFQMAYANPSASNAGIVHQTSCASLLHGFSFAGCVADAVYYSVFFPASHFLILAGWAFDAVVTFSLSYDIVSGGALVSKGWTHSPTPNH
jgi:hypothetical protein